MWWKVRFLIGRGGINTVKKEKSKGGLRQKPLLAGRWGG